ncbi:hypothetical protein ARMSODRAFT_778954 [Armillaria solidipes]|uniref:Uncharacterized protein n=1 Tax=Armillaria solidipes TaxID=1076256 RepID=A0A2H3BRG0_9AGAR|nr:hypothetical protein ARMSODRAFT_778954 [Armillaria solidipes]
MFRSIVWVLVTGTQNCVVFAGRELPNMLDKPLYRSLSWSLLECRRECVAYLRRSEAGHSLHACDNSESFFSVTPSFSRPAFTSVYYAAFVYRLNPEPAGSHD